MTALFSTCAATANFQKLVAIDPNVPDAELLIRNVDRDSKVLLIETADDFLYSIRSRLQECPDISQLHIVTHGRPGEIQLNGRFVGAGWFMERAGLLVDIGMLLGKDAEILFYGCEVAKGEYGERFLGTVEILSSVAVRASSTLTGEESLGGDWSLDWSSKGGSGPELAFNQNARQQYRGVLEDPLFGEEQVNTVTQGAQDHSQVVALAGGGYVVVWQTPNKDGSGLAVAAQMFTAAGVPVGTEILVNSNYLSDQEEPAVAATADGGFVVAWNDQGGHDGSGWGVFAQRFNASGESVGDEFQVNTVTSSAQNNVSIVGLEGGGFVAVYASNGLDGSGYAIAMQRFDASGNPAGIETVVNSATAGSQLDPVVEAMPGGGYVVLWTDQNAADGNGYGVFGQIYNGTGAAVGGEFQVNQSTSSHQYEQAVSVFPDGSFVAVWRDDSGLDGSGVGVFGRLFNADGSPQGDQFQINSTTSGSQYEPDVLALPDGTFVAAWYDSSIGEAVKREFDATGAPTEVEQRVDGTSTNSESWVPQIADLGNGNYVITYTNWQGADGDGYGIFQQVFGDPAEISRQGNPELDGVNSTVTFQEDDVNAAPQLIDANGAVAFSDFDSRDFDGGVLEVSYLLTDLVATEQFLAPDNLTQSQLGILNQGVAAGEIGVSGSNVTYGGVIIGTIEVDGSNGSKLRVLLNGDADAAAMERLVENLTYQNLSDDPLEQFQLNITVTDGDGGSTGAVPVIVVIEKNTDGAVSVGDESQVNSFIDNNQDDPSIGALTDGGYVIAWTSRDQDSESDGVYAQRFDANGVLVGPEFQVNSTVQGAQLAPQVTGLDNGGFVITWTDTSGLDGSGNGVFAQVYGSDGATLGTEFQVNTQNSSTQNAPAIAALDNGFVVTWSSWNVDGNSQGIAAQRYDNSGAQAGVEFVVNTTSAGSQTDPDVAKLSSGGFVVIWTDQAGADGASWGTFAQRFDANGVMAGPEFQVNSHTVDSQYEAKIGALSDGGFVVAWRDNSGHDSAGNGVFAQRFDSAGNAVGDEFRVNELTASTQYEPDVIGLSDGGFVITWSSWDSDGSSYGISGQQYDADGHRIDGEFQVNTATSSNQTQSVLAALPNGNFVSAWTAATSGDSGDGSNTGVFQQLWGDPSEFSLQESPELEAFNSEITFQEDIVNAAPQLLDANASVVLVDADSADFAGGSLLVSLLSQPEVLLGQYLAPDNLSQDQLGIRNQGVTEGQIGVSGVNVTYGGVVIGTIVSDGANGAALEVDFNSSADDEAVEALLENLTYANTSDDPVATRQYRIQVSDGDGGSSVPQVVTVNIEVDRDGVEAVGEEQQVNSFISQNQDEPSIGALTGGGYVIAWTSRGQDSSNDGIFAQRFDANGVLVGPELQVNTHVQGDQNDPQVTGLSNGGFVISWTDTSSADGSGNGVFAQVFDGNGLPVGNEFLVNTETSSTQNLSSIASLSGGGFVATWMSNSSGSAGDGNRQGIIAQRFDNSGALIDGEFVVNTTITNNQTDPHIIGLTGGGFVVVWTDQGGADGASWGTFGQRFNADGSTAGGEFQINTSTSGSQYEPSVGALSDGGFVVAWRDDDGLDGNSGAGVFAQRFAANGTEVGEQFRVNEFTSSTQYDPVVIGLDEGGFVITWSSWGADGDSYGVSGQQYDAGGNRIDGEFQVNSSTASWQYQPAVAALPQGNFVTAWSGYTSGDSGDGSEYGVFQQLWGDPSEFSQQQAPEIEGFSSEITFQENAVNAAPQLLDSNGSVSLFDDDSADFDGGSLLVTRLSVPVPLLEQYADPDNLTQDQLSVRNQGIGAGQIGLDSGNVTFGGTIIGSVVSDGADGTALEIQFNSGATEQSVEALIENLTYQNSSDDPVASRQFRIQVSDGDGGSSTPHVVTVNIDAERDGVQAIREEMRVNTYINGDQDQPAVAATADGGYIVVWTTQNQGGIGDEIFLTGYDADGQPIGAQIRANESFVGNQSDPQIAVLSNGNFVVSWTDDSGIDGSVSGVYARVFDSAGQALGSQLLVNTTTANHQNQSSIASLDGGGFVATWTSQTGSGTGIYGQRFDNDGNTVGGEFEVQLITSQSMGDSDVVGLPGGGFVAIWTDYAASDGSGWGTFGQRYDAMGVAAGSVFQVNTFGGNNQYEAKVAALLDGGFVVAWLDDSGLDGAGSGIFAQRYAADGSAVGDQFRVNDFTSSTQYQPEVIGMSDGGFVISWSSWGADGDSYGVSAQQYDADGNRVDGEFQVNSNTSHYQYQSAMAALPGGNFVSVWSTFSSGDSGDGSGYGISHQLWGNPSDFSDLEEPEIIDLDFDVEMLAADVGAGPQIIDDSILLLDSDSPDFDGSGLSVYLVHANSPITADDSLGINDQGMAAGQIGVSGGSVFYGGTEIGLIAADGSDGIALRVFTNANATREAVQALMQNITYENTAADPTGLVRSYAFAVGDGDGPGVAGGISRHETVTISVVDTLSSPVIELENLAPYAEFTEDSLQQTPGLLDEQVQFTDHSSNGFDGGTIEVSFPDWPYGDDDELLGIHHEGVAPGQIGVSGTDISYGGVVVATVDATDNGEDGNNLTLNLNATADEAAIEALIESITYQNNSDLPEYSRSVRIIVTDMDGNATAAQDIEVEVEPSINEPQKVFGEQQVNTFTEGAQDSAAIASLNDGGYVIVWKSNGQDGFGDGIFGQRYDDNGVLVGPEFSVNSQVLSSQYQPAVAALSTGGFVVTWTDQHSASDGHSYGVFSQRFDSNSIPVGDETLVNTTTTSNQYESSVAGLPGGGYVVVWRDDGNLDGSAAGVFAQRFNGDGSKNGSEFQVNTEISSHQYNPAISSASDGSFVVVWTSNNSGSAGDGNGEGVFARRYDTSGVALGDEFQVNTETTSNQDNPAVAVLSDGGFVVAWSSNDQDGSGQGIYAQRFDASGAAVGDEFLANETTSGNQSLPSVTALGNGGFVIAWQGDGVGDSSGVFGQQYDATGNRVDEEFRINTETASTQAGVKLAGLSDGNFVAAWHSSTSGTAGDGSSNGVFQQIFGEPGDFGSQMAPVLEGFSSDITFDEDEVNADPQLLDANGSVALSDMDSPNFDGGRVLVTRLNNPEPLIDEFKSPDDLTQDQLGILNEGMNVGEIGVSGSDISYGGTVIGTIDSSGANGSALDISLNANATVDAVQALVESLTYQNTSDDPVAARQYRIQVADGDGGSSEPLVVSVNITPSQDGVGALFGEQQVNSFTEGAQDNPAIAKLSDGGYVIVWKSNGQDGSGEGIFGQRYDANGVLVGPEFAVNTQVLSGQFQPAVAALSTGGFVVTWTDQNSSSDGSSYGVFSQRYDSNGSAVGAEALVNTTISSNQYESSVAGLPGGEYVVVWRDDSALDGSASGVFAQRFNADGSKSGGEFQVNTETDNHQFQPSVSSADDGSFVVAWTSYNSGDAGDGNARGVFARRYDSAGNPIGDEFQVNSEINDDQEDPVVAILSDGGFVVAWESHNQDSSGHGIYAQRYDASGNAVGDEFRANETLTSSQSFPSVTALENGGFVIAWSGDGIGDNSGVFGQQYDANGNRVDGEFRINTETASSQGGVALTGLNNGNFVATWHSATNGTAGDGNGNGVFQQVFGNPADFVTQAAPELEGLSSEITFDENAVNAAPQLLDTNGSVALSDADSPVFDGGRVLVTRLNNPEPLIDELNAPDDLTQDHLGILNEGIAAGEIGISGTDVSYGGVVIGTIDSDGVNGSALDISLNSSATVEAVQALVESLTYQNTSDDPIASRQYRVQVTDGDGGSSEPQVITVNITPSQDGVGALSGEQQVNGFTAGHQDNAEIAVLNDGGYVVVWESNGQDGSGEGIFGQRYDANGVLVGPEFAVNTQVLSGQHQPAVAALSSGGFVVTWTDQNSNSDGSVSGVFSQRYDSNGIAVGNEALVNTETSSTQYESTVAGLPGGGYVVAWRDDGSLDGSSAGVFAQRFNADGSHNGVQFQVNVETSSHQFQPSVVSADDGSFVVVWTSNTNGSAGDGSARGVFARRYDSSGNAITGEFQVNSEINDDQEDPVVAILSDGGFVVAWESHNQDTSGHGIYAQRYDASGNTVGEEFRVNETLPGSQSFPAITALENGGFVVAWSGDGVGDNQGVFGQQYDANGNRVDGEFLINTETASTQAGVALAGLSNGNFVAAWHSSTSGTAGDGDSNGVFQKIFGNPVDFVSEAAPELDGINRDVFFTEQELNAAPRLLDANGTVALSDSNSSDFDGGSLLVTRLNIPEPLLDQFNDPDNLTQDQLGIRNEGTDTGQIGVNGNQVSYAGVVIGTIVVDGVNGNPLQVDLNGNATVEAVERLVENVTYRNISDDPLLSHDFRVQVSDGDGGTSVPQIVTVHITPTPDGAVPFGPERIANTESNGNQTDSAATALSDGTFVVVWSDEAGLDGNNWGIFGQRFDAEGNKLGDEFQVNTQTFNPQVDAAVAALDNGEFVVTWTDQNSGNPDDNSGHGVYSQRFETNGVSTPASSGAETLVNTHVSSSQYESDVAAFDDGSYVVVWSSDNQDGHSSGVFAQRFDENGAPDGAEFQVNVEISSRQYEPTVTTLSNGSFVVTWTSNTNGTAGDGNSDGVFARLYGSDGTPQGSEFQVNTETVSTQRMPAVAGLADGGFVVTWQSADQDTWSNGIFAQRFDSSGNAINEEFRVNDHTVGTQQRPAIVALDTGGFVIAWNDGNAQDGSGWGVFAQRYDADGARIDSQFQVNTGTHLNQDQPALFAMVDGSFGVTWSTASSSGIGDGSGDAIAYQLYRNVAPVSTDVFATGPEDVPIVLDNVLFESGFNDPDGQGLAHIVIEILPGQGQLLLNGAPVNPGDEITLEQLANHELVYSGNPDFNGNDAFAWRGSDGLVLSQESAQTDIVVTPVNDAPGLDAGVDANVTESFGHNFSRNLILNDPDTDTFQITVDWGDGSDLTFSTANKTPFISHRYLDDGIYTVQVTVDDGAGQPESVEVQTFNVAVSNVIPGLNISGTSSVEEDTTYTLTLGIPSDPGEDTVTEYRIDWGDGSLVQTIAAIDVPGNRQIEHIYADSDTVPNDYTISVSVTDDDGDHDNVASMQVTVSEPAEVITVDAGAGFTVNEGTAFSLPVTFQDPTDQNGDGWTYTIDWGDGNTSTGADFDRAFNGGHSYADQGVYTVTVSVTDDGSSQPAGVDSVEITVDNVAPVINLIGASSTPEGSLYTLTLNTFDPGNDQIAEYRIDWGDGSAEEVFTAGQFPSNGQLQHLYVDGPDTFDITATVIDEDGTFVNSRAINVTNVAPTVTLSGASNVDEGSPYTLNIGNISDPGQDTITNYIIHWGDGTSSAVSQPGDVVHVYADGVSNPTITLTVDDEDGRHNNAGSLSLTVDNVVPTLGINGADSVDEGSVYTLNLEGIVDPGNDTHTIEVNWGDGTVEAVAVGTASVTHTFADGPNSYDIAVTVTESLADDPTASSTAVKTVTVNNVAPVVALSGDTEVDEGSPYTLTLGAITDPGMDTVSDYVIDWGDGVVETVAVADLPLSGELIHTYADGDSSPTIRVDLVDEDGTHEDAGLLNLTVNNVAPVLPISGDDSVDEGSVYTLNLGALVDPGTSDSHMVSVNWGDGTVESVNPSATSITHTFVDGDASFDITVTVGDGEDSTTATKTVMVNNVAPVLALSGAAVINTGQVYALTLGDVMDPGQDTVASYVIDWGDGNTETVLAGDLPPSREVTHTFDNAGNVTVSIDLIDEDGTYIAVDTHDVAISDPPLGLSLSVGGDETLDEGSTFTRTISFTDGEDSAGDGWSYSIDWGDGSDLETGTTTDMSFVISRSLVDGANNQTVTVTVDDNGESTSESFELITNNVAPELPISGDDSVDEGSVYTLSLGALVDPGVDDSHMISVDWGDGTVESVAVGATSITHTFADGDASFDIAVTVGDGEDSTTAIKTVMVNNVAPILPISGDDSVDEGSVYTLNLGALVDPGVDDSHMISVDWGDGTVESVAVDATSITHTFTDGDASFDIAVTVGDGEDSTTATKTVMVNNVAPVLHISGDDSVDEGSVYTLNLGMLVDPGADDSHMISVDWGDGSVEAVAVGASSITHTFTDGGANFDIAVTVGDGEDSTTATKSVQVHNVAPILSISGADNVDEGSVYTLNLGTIVDPGADSHTVLVDWGDGDSEVISVGTTSVTHTFADGLSTPTIAVTVTDDEGDQTTATKTITVNNVAPQVSDDSYSTSFDETLTVDAANGVLANDSDPGSDTLEVISHQQGALGLLSINADGSFIYTPNIGASGTETLTYTVSDGEDQSQGEITFTIGENQNTPPIAQDDSYQVHANEVLNIDALAGVLANDTDLDGDTLSVISFQQGVNGAFVMQADGSFTYEPDPGFVGTETVAYTTSDGTATAQGVLSVEVVNEAPEAVDDVYTMRPNEVLNVDALTGVLANDTDLDGDALNVISFQQGVNGTFVMQTDGSFIYTPNPGFVGTETVAYTIGDGITTAQGSLTVEVLNDAPEALADSYSMRPNDVLSIDALAGVLANDTDLDGDALNVISFQQGVNGTFVMQADGSFTYEPDPGFVGTETVTYTISDGVATAQATLTVEVVNAAPEAVADVYTTAFGETLTVDAAAGVLANDTDLDGDALNVISFQQGTLGTVVMQADGSFSYTPNTGVSGSETLNYTISDGTTTTQGQMTFTIESNENVAPVAQDDTFFTTEADSIAGNVLDDNGNGVDADADGDVMAVTEVNGSAVNVGSQVTLASGALLLLNSDGTFSYDPNGAFDALNNAQQGIDSFTYAVSDGNGGEDEATVNLIINGISETTTIHLGDAPTRLSRRDRDAWRDAWSEDGVEITHRADAESMTESWSDVLLASYNNGVLLGGDITQGELGVSGQSQATGVAPQELEGTEALRFDLDGVATAVTVDMAWFFANDNGSGLDESARLQALDDNGEVVAEMVASADSATGRSTLQMEVEQGFSELVITAGVYDGDEFVFGALADANGGLGSEPSVGSGSDFLLDSIEFEFGSIPAPAPLGGALAQQNQQTQSAGSGPVLDDGEAPLIGIGEDDNIV